ncbi:U32 family peptidase [Agaribacterium sp. ZY112]|uniref:U32 family peptidase n=1 Tax=Agaribacterium sp. ZY112 TaxID=3233574 RepID=UPI003523BB7B
MKLTLAPIPFYWPKAQVIEFYKQAALWPVERIIVGETVCSKRRELSSQDWLEIAQELQAAGKEVVLSSLALIESESEFNSIKKLCDAGFEVEANDLGAAEIFHQAGLSFSGGHFLNIYNIECLKILREDGLQRWTLPVELGKKELIPFLNVIQEEKLDIKTEVFAHGYLPLALSARCFTARALDKPKDRCEKICLNYPEGIAVDSQEGQRLFTINGIQTLSGTVMDLVSEVEEMKSLGVDAIRLSPSRFDMEAVLHSYRQAIDGNSTKSIIRDHCNGYWYGSEGMKRVEDQLEVLM